tara:strand:- start:152 stop:784 length:633 start_codon:yes stop_codon:yes gene_type:complete
MYASKDRSVLEDFLNPLLNSGLSCYEIGAGTGLIAKRFGSGFASYTAIEPDAEYYSELIKRCDGSFSTVQGYIEADPSNNYNLGLCVFNVINHITPNKLGDFISKNRKKLTTDGVLYFDCYRHEAVMQSPPKSHSFRYGSNEIFIKTEQKCSVLELSYSMNGVVFDEMILYIHQEEFLERCIKKEFSNFTRTDLAGRYGDFYFSQYVCYV